MPSAITLRDNGFADKGKQVDVFNATTLSRTKRALSFCRAKSIARSAYLF